MRPATRTAWVVAALAVAVRLAYAFSLTTDAGPVGATGRVLMGDERAYESLARDFANDTVERERAFYQEPAYAWLVGRVFDVLPPDPLPEGSDTVIEPSTPHLWIFVLQHLLGVLVALMVARLGNRVGGPRTGLLAGVFAALSGPMIFHEAMLLKASLGLFMFTGMLLSWLSVLDGAPRPARERIGGALGLGLLLGAGILLRGNMYLALAAVVFSLLCGVGSAPGVRWPRRARVPEALLVALAALALLVPSLLHNLHLGDRVLTTYQSGSNAVIGMPDHDGVRMGLTYVPLLAGRGDAFFEETDAVSLAEAGAGRPLRSHEISAWWWREWWRRVVSRPGVAAARAGLKALSTFHGDEIPDVKDWQFFRTALPWLGSPLSDLHWLGPLAFVGLLVLPWRRRPSLLVVRAGLGVVVLSLALFYVMGRYRLSAAPCLWILAAGAIDRGLSILAPGRLGDSSRVLPRSAWTRTFVALLAMLILVLGVITRVGTPMLTLRPDIGGSKAFQTAWANYASVELHHANVSHEPDAARAHRDEAVDAARHAVELAPLFPAGWQKLVIALDAETEFLTPRSDEASSAAWRLLLVMEGDRTGIDTYDTVHTPIEHVKAAAMSLRQRPTVPGRRTFVGPTLAWAARRVAQGLKARDQQLTALALADVSLDFAPDEPLGHALRGAALKRLDRVREAIDAYRSALAGGADTLQVRNNLGNALLSLGQRADARLHFERALQLSPANPVVLRNLERCRQP